MTGVAGRTSPARMLAGATASAAGYTAVQVLGRRAGSRAHERAARLPGDELVHDPRIVTNHGVTIEGRAEEIWPWLTQLGWHLGGHYTPHWVDELLFPENWESLQRLDPRRRVEQRATPLSSGREPLHQELYLTPAERGDEA